MIVTIWCQLFETFSILMFQGHKGQKGHYSSWKQEFPHLQVKISKIALLTFRSNNYTTQKANLDLEVADNLFKGQNVP